METILASIRRIISEEEAPHPAAAAAVPGDDEVVVLDDSMMVHPAPPAPSEPGPPSDSLLAPQTRIAASQAFAALHAVSSAASSPALLRSGGPTLEDIVRDELRGQLKSWLDANLPALVERLVRFEIERLHRPS
ncbi:MAG: DUF2497 domain-containing protein [Gluconacetobacter diazotrophicus]|nr:DUF2497 domain-containing protein [Gluconacetobacter diazotrophicus]